MLSGFDKEINTSPSTSDGRVKVDAADVAGYLQDKLTQGSNIILTVNQNNIVINAEVQTAIDKTLESFTKGHEIQNDGTAVKQRPILNFAGASVSVVDDEQTGATVVTIDSPDGHVIYVNSDNAVPQRSGLKFVGGRVTTTDDPTGEKTVITIEGGYTIQSEGSALTGRKNLNFTGDAVTITDNGNADSTIINIKKHVIQEEGGELPPRTHLNFVGSGIIATDDSANDRTNITLTNAGGSGHIIQDEGVTLTGRAKLNFVGESVTVTDDSTNDASVVNIATAGRLIVTHATNATVNAQSGYHYVCHGVTTLNLPAGVAGMSVGISDIGNTFSANPITINPNGNDHIGKPLQTELTLDRNMSCVILGFADGVWAYLSAESFNDLGVGSGATGGGGVGIEDGDKGDMIVTGNGTNWALKTTSVVAGSYAIPSITVDAKGRITSASENSIPLSSDVTWYVAADGDANADGLTVGTPITLEEAASRVYRVVPTDTNFTITIEIADGSYTYANNYVFVAPPTEFGFAIKLHGQDWVGVNTLPTANISTKTLEIQGFSDNYCYIENIHGRFSIDDSEVDLYNNATTSTTFLDGTKTYCFVWGKYKFSAQTSIGFNVYRGYLELDADFDDNGTSKNFAGAFVSLGYNAVLAMYNTPVVTGSFTGLKLRIQSPDCYIDEFGVGESGITSLPGDVMPTYPNYLFASSNTFATVVSPPATASSTGTAGQIAYDASYIYICTATNTWLRASIATW